MKLICLPVLSLALAASASAADLSPNKLGPLLQKPLSPLVYRLDLDYVQTHDESDRQFIQRRASLAIGLPAHLEFGFALLDTQEPQLDHSSRPLGAQTWLRWNMLQSSLFTAAGTLQFQPGLASEEALYQASQDRTSLGMELTSHPWSWLSGSVYASYSRRQDERFQTLQLGAETVAGARINLGTPAMGLYGESLQRHLTARNLETSETKQLFAREWQAGFYAGTDDLQLKTFALIPDTHRYFGMPERGFGASLTILIGAPSQDARNSSDGVSSAGAKMERSSGKVQKAPESEIKILETDEQDDFQMLETKRQGAEQNQKESPAEKAEREIRQSLEAEQKKTKEKTQDEEQAKRDAAKAYQQRVQEAEDAYREYKDDVNSEINRYTLPDQDELNWNGLTP